MQNKSPVKRIMIIGCCGAGKSTLAKKLHQLTQLPVFHLDQYYWKPDWVESTTSEWGPKVEELATQEAWIIDGNYSGTIDSRLKRADTIIYLDYSTINCLWRITKRIFKYHGETRPDMTEGCVERFDLEFYHYVAVYNLTRRKQLLEKLSTLPTEKSIFILKNDSEVEQFLEGLIQKQI